MKLRKARSKTVRLAGSHVITTCATIAALLLFVALGSQVLPAALFGAPLANQQAVAHRIADLATDLEAAHLLVYSAASAYDENAEPQLQSRRSAMAKLFATEAAQQIVDECVQLHGAVALRSGHLLEQLYRDVRSLRIYEGASEIQRTIIARDLIGMDATR